MSENNIDLRGADRKADGIDTDEIDTVSTLDLSSLDSYASCDDTESTLDLGSLESYVSYDDTVAKMESGSISVETGIMHLKKTADEGCSRSFVYLGKLYGDKNAPWYDPSLAFECFSGATKLDSGEGYYYLGLCYMNGIGCDADPVTAVEMLLRGGERGHTESICALAICREEGVGCETDYAMAVRLYERAAEEGSATAINNLGGCYFYGHGVEQNKEYATELYERAADLGNANAACRLGICYEDGDGCEQDLEAAFSYYKKAAEGGNRIAMYRLALCYDNGVGVEQNFAKAFAYCNRSANAGYAPAIYQAGMMSKSGRGTKKNASAAYKMFSMAAEAGLSAAEYEVGNCYLEGSGTVRNPELAYLRYLGAYEGDSSNGDAAFKLGLCNLKGLGTETDEKVAFEWFCRGAELGSPDAAYMKGECYLFGVGVDGDAQKATASYLEALSCAADGFVCEEAHLAMAKCLERGVGVERDPASALRLYKTAAENGNAEAMYNLGRLILTGAGSRSEQFDARTYMLRAARIEYVPAMLAMGRFADEGRGVAKNSADAERWYTKAVGATARSAPELNDFPQRFYEKAEHETDCRIEAQYRLGLLMAKREPSLRSYLGAFENIAFAASMGHDGAQLEISKIFVHGGDLKSYYETDFGENGEDAPSKEIFGSAMNKLGDAYFDGKALVKKNEVAAARCYKIAAELGDVDASYSYGWCLRHGVGLNENDAEAVKWLKLAADRGNINAAYSYGLCCEEGSGTGIKNKREARSYYRKAASAGHLEAAKRYMALSKD